MRSILAAIVLLSGFSVVLAAPAELSELQKLKAKSYLERRSSLPARLEYEKAQAIDAIGKKYQQEIVALEKERTSLESDYRVTLSAPPSDAFEWATLTFKPAKPEKQP